MPKITDEAGAMKQVRDLKAAGKSYRQIQVETGRSQGFISRALKTPAPEPAPESEAPAPETKGEGERFEVKEPPAPKPKEAKRPSEAAGHEEKKQEAKPRELYFV